MTIWVMESTPNELEFGNSFWLQCLGARGVIGRKHPQSTRTPHTGDIKSKLGEMRSELSTLPALEDFYDPSTYHHLR